MRRLLDGRRPPDTVRRETGPRLLRAAARGGAIGVLAGAALLAFATSPAGGRSAASATGPASSIDATHVPPLLLLAGEPARLGYDVYCPPPGGDPESGAPCDAEGTVYVRAGESGAFAALPLRLDDTASVGRYAATVPAPIASAEPGLSYYAVLRDRTTGASTTLPAAGPAAPLRVRTLDRPLTVALGPHVFGATRPPSAHAAEARWGDGPGEAGLEQGPQLGPIGAASFDVDGHGAVALLDEAHRRVLRFGADGSPAGGVAVPVQGTIADLALGPDGAMTVLETVGSGGAQPLVRRLDAGGRQVAATALAGRGSTLRAGPDGPAALEYPDGEWMPVGDGAGAAEQRRRARVGRPVGAGDELVAEREGDEARVALVGPAGVRVGWRITSPTPLGEIQLAEPYAGGVVVVLRVYTDDRDEFDVLVLDRTGLRRRFSVPSAAWAETAPLARFRLHGPSLYELGSTAARVFVDRYDLEVPS